MNLARIKARTEQIARCAHNMWHYLDAEGNRRCHDCDAYVRPNEHAKMTDQPMPKEVSNATHA